MATRINYRKLAFAAYPPICTYCGFGVPEVLEVAHLDGNRDNNDIENLAILCPNCHKMHDIDLIPTETILLMRDREWRVAWSKRMKEAGAKAAATRKRRQAAKRAVATRRRNAEGQ
jgi:5-methylcytosine-specific restriction endonuclease McrA